jgi:SAM-dependent methyltransferase
MADEPGTSTSPAGVLNPVTGICAPELSRFSSAELGAELLRRLRSGDSGFADMGSLSESFSTLAHEIEHRLDLPGNRLSRRKLRDHLANSCRVLLRDRIPVEGMTVVELGCGSLHPLGVVFQFVILGAAAGIGVDLDTPQSLQISARALAHAAALALMGPDLLFDFVPGLTREAILRNLHGIDLPRLWHGDIGGVGSRLRILQASADATGLTDGSVDLVTSTSFLEHVRDAAATLREIARVTRCGGRGAHSIDGADHRSYSDQRIGPLDFLCIPSTAPIVHECNRIRPLEFVSLFEAHGFRVDHVERHLHHQLGPNERARFHEPWRSMPADVLQTLSLTIYVTRA